MGKFVIVIGAQWGDEGKGKVVDLLTEHAAAVARFQGGHNAGHTLVVGDMTYKLSLLPSGIVRGTLSVIGNGVVLDPWALRDEVEKLRTFAFLPNQCVIFVKTFNSLHGVPPMTGPPGVMRRTLTINIERAGIV